MPSTRSTASISDARVQRQPNTPARQTNPFKRMKFSQLLTRAEVTAGDVERSFTFRLNPTNLKVSLKKLQQWILTKFGFERQYWGNQLWVFNYTGSSEVFKPNPGEIDYSGRFDITKTAAWFKFRQFENFFLDTGDQNIQMSYWAYDFMFVGTLDDFTFTCDSDRDPHRITYSFTYSAMPIIQPQVLLEYNPDPTIQPNELPQLDAGTPGPTDDTRTV